MLILIIWVGVLVVAVTLYFWQIYSYFKKYDVKYLTPMPFFGNMGKVIFRVEHFAISMVNLYNAFPGERFIGRYDFTTPMIVIRDLDLIKKITVKDFENFLDHRALISNSDSLFSRNLIALKGQEWKDMRSALSPAFTSSKIRLMVPFMVEVGDQMIASIKKKIKSSNDGYIDIDCKDLTSRYANDVIASCAFGLKVDSHTDVNNRFFEVGRNLLNFGIRQTLILYMILGLPKLSKVFKLDLLEKASKQFFSDLVLGNMKDRELKNIVRPDMIHLLMAAKKGNLSHENIKSGDEGAGFATVTDSSIGVKPVNRVWTDSDLVAQATVFFVAGFETVSTAMTFLLYELALNPEVQEKLAQEIKDHGIKNGEKFDLKSVQEMSYLDMVVSESLRMWPPAVLLDRICTKDYNLGRPNDTATKDFILRKGKGILIPTFAFHRDPQYFPNPDKFDPERFSEENKHKIQPFTYSPFGLGPRNCIGSRFALCELKVMIYQILQHVVVSPCEKTCIPAKLSKSSVTVKLEGGHWLRFKNRC